MLQRTQCLDFRLIIDAFFLLTHTSSIPKILGIAKARLELKVTHFFFFWGQKNTLQIPDRRGQYGKSPIPADDLKIQRLSA